LKSAIVIGAGFVGTACAWQLQQCGYHCTVVDPGEQTAAASWGNAGHLAIEQIDPLASMANLRSLPGRLFSLGGPVGLPWRDAGAWLPFGLRLMAAATPQRFAKGRSVLASLLAQAMPAWQRLADQTGTAQYLQTDGHFVVWESEKTTQQGQRHWLGADVGTALVRPATPEELASLRQRFNGRPLGAVRFQNTGQIMDLAKMRQAIVQALCKHGGRLETASVQSIQTHTGRAAVKLHNGALLNADLVLVAAGMGSATLLQPSEGAIPLIAERGYHLEASQRHAEEAHALPPVAFEDRSVIVTQFLFGLRIAGFTEFSSINSNPDPRKWRCLAQHAQALGLPMGPKARQWIGSRPTLPDYLPAVGRSRLAPNLLYAFGHQHLGVTLAAVTGELVASLARGAEPVVDVRPLNLDRFQ